MGIALVDGGGAAITMEDVSRAMDRLRALVPENPKPSPLLPWLDNPWRIIADPHLPDPLPHRRGIFLGSQAMVNAWTPPRPFTFWERVRVWFEDLVDRAELTPELFPWPRVKRPRREPIAAFTSYRFGQTLVMRPEAAAYLGTVA